MKKLMFVAAVAAGLAVIGDGIESNTVGYNTFNLTTSQKVLKGVSFQTVAGGSIDLQDIKPYDGSEISDGGFLIWWWEPGVGNKYAVWNSYWYDPTDPEADEDGLVFAEGPADYKWTDQNDDAPAVWAKTFSAGDGFFTQPTATSPKLTISGGIIQPGENAAYYPVALTMSQKVLIANPFPVSYLLSDVVPFDGDAVSDGNFTIWWWEPGVGNKYAVWNSYWYDPTDPDADEDGLVFAEETTDYKWTDQNDEAPAVWAKTFSVGEGFFTQPTATNPILKFPNPFYVAP